MLKPDGHPVLARFLDTVMAGMLPVRRRVIPWAKGRVLEVGCGTGANFRFYGPLESLVAIEPDPHMRKRAEVAMASLRFPAQLLSASAEALPFDDASFDTVVCSFVLCTIPDARAAAQEMHRVLKPGGRLVFTEHVCSGGAGMRRVQGLVTPLWSHFGGGCRLNNDAIAQLEAAGFELEIRSSKRSDYDPFPVVFGLGRRQAGAAESGTDDARR